MPKEITMPQLATYEHPSYFFLNTAAEGVEFRAPVNGATTKGSSYPRSELRQMNPGGGSPAAWSNTSDKWTMECEIAFTHLPGGKPHVVGMQAHDQGGDSGVGDITVLRLEDDQLYATKENDPHYDLIDGSYALGTWLDMTLIGAGGAFRWYRDGVQVAQINGNYSGCYYKAGCYTQANTSNGTGYGGTHIRRLKIFKG